ncbi:poliovirus receptor isoform 2-T2 [Clarias gariepinus]|uniref:nectin-2 isoform X2 n=1 Tax=Clarias gariepinus TaxID=13013 RepID=UPI00234CCBE5|nr:nectin-2 isoform X2 [Clarias gariepinus]
MVRDSGLCSTTGFLILLIILKAQGLSAQKVRVEPEVVSYPGQTVTLRCQFPDPSQTQLTQVSWILESGSNPRTNIAVFHPTFGVNYPPSPVYGRVSFTAEPPTLASPTIQITEIQLTDEGKYICEFAAYPSGNEQGVTSLIILAKPVNSARTITVSAGSTPVSVASCESANGRPPASITWITALNGNSSAPVTTDNSDNTVTVRGEYMLIPTAADHGKDITCEVSHRTLSRPETFPMKLVVQYPPQVQIVGYDNNWYMGRTSVALTCQYQGNPSPPTVNWKVSSGFLPDSVEVNHNKLTIRKVDDAVNNTFICEVTNSLGTGKDQVTVFVREAPMPPSNAGVVAGAVIGSFLALLLVGALIGVLITRSRRQQQGYRGNSKGNSAPYDSVARLFGSSGSKNGTGNHGNNNAPIYKGDVGLSEKAGNIGVHQGGVALVENTPTAQDILLSGELDEAERRKFDELEDEDEHYDQFSGSGPILQLRPHNEEPSPAYLDDDMESQRDGSIISRTAVYV